MKGPGCDVVRIDFDDKGYTNSGVTPELE